MYCSVLQLGLGCRRKECDQIKTEGHYHFVWYSNDLRVGILVKDLRETKKFSRKRLTKMFLRAQFQNVWSKDFNGIFPIGNLKQVFKRYETWVFDRISTKGVYWSVIYIKTFHFTVLKYLIKSALREFTNCL